MDGEVGEGQKNKINPQKMCRIETERQTASGARPEERFIPTAQREFVWEMRNRGVWTGLDSTRPLLIAFRGFDGQTAMPKGPKKKGRKKNRSGGGCLPAVRYTRINRLLMGTSCQIGRLAGPWKACLT